MRLKTPTAPIQLFDQANDVAEKVDVAAAHPKVVARVAELFKTVRADNQHWKLDAP